MKARAIYSLQLLAVSVGTVLTGYVVESYTGSKRMGALALIGAFLFLLTVHVLLSTFLEFREFLREQRKGDA